MMKQVSNTWSVLGRADVAGRGGAASACGVPTPYALLDQNAHDQAFDRKGGGGRLEARHSERRSTEASPSMGSPRHHHAEKARTDTSWSHSVTLFDGVPCRATLGQATVEAALLLPVLLFFFAFLLQPACVLYTRSVMEGAAAEGARALATAHGDAATPETVREFVLRRLEAVPNLDLFHVGGRDGWSIELEGGDTEQQAHVSVTAHARPLPFFGGITHMMGEIDGDGLLIKAEVNERVRPDWLGGSYSDWTEMWG